MKEELTKLDRETIELKKRIDTRFEAKFKKHLSTIIEKRNKIRRIGIIEKEFTNERISSSIRH